MNDQIKTTITSPDSLLDDDKSFAFYVLRDETLALCKLESELPYQANRSTYLSNGRFSPKFKTIIFWPNPVNPQRALDLLIESGHVDSTYTWQVSGASTTIKKHAPKTNSKITKLENIRQSEVKNLMDAGMKIQECPKETSE